MSFSVNCLVFRHPNSKEKRNRLYYKLYTEILLIDLKGYATIKFQLGYLWKVLLTCEWLY